LTKKLLTVKESKTEWKLKLRKDLCDMKRKGPALTRILSLLISTLAATLLVHVATANPFMPSGSWSDEPIPPSINVQSPSETQNYHSGSDVWLNFTVTEPLTNWYSTESFRYPKTYATTSGNLTQVRFSLDGKQDIPVSKISESALKNSGLYNPQGGVLHFSVNLGQLSVGQHTIDINAEGSTYYGNLTHSSWSDSFQNYVQASDKTKIVHSSLQSSFVVDGVKPSTPLEPFPTLSILAISAAIVAVACVGSVVYFKKLRHARSNS
jgi:hypothetical protein